MGRRSGVRWWWFAADAVAVGALFFAAVYFGANPVVRAVTSTVKGKPPSHPYGHTALLHMASWAGGIAATLVVFSGLTGIIDGPSRRR